MGVSTIPRDIVSANKLIGRNHISEEAVACWGYNNTGGSLSRGTLVYKSGHVASTGVDLPLVSKADADSAATTAQYVVLETSATGSKVKMARVATIDGLNTNGRTLGDAVYLSSTAGGFSFTSAGVGQKVGIVVDVSNTDGSIHFDIPHGFGTAGGSVQELLTATGQAFAVTATLNEATATVEALEVSLSAVTTARTGGVARGLRVAMTGLAGDTSGTTYVAVSVDAAATGGSGVYTAFLVEAGDWTRLLDLSALTSGQGGIILADNLANAVEFREGSNSYLLISTTNGAEALVFGRPIASPQSATAQDVATGNTITLPTSSTKRLTATAAAATGVILTAGVTEGQRLTLLNVHATNSITFAAAGTSNVADGTSSVIAPLKAVTFVWDTTAARWFSTY